jgi:hypothetical protein
MRRRKALAVGLGALPPLAGDELSAPRRCEDFAVLVNDLTPPDRDDRPTCKLPARKDREPSVCELVLIPNGSFQVRIPYHNIAIRSDRDGSLARVQAKQLGRIRRRHRDHLLQRDASGAHAFRIQQR